MTMMATRMSPDNVLISIILSNPTPIVPSNNDDASANIPMTGNTIIASMKHIMKL